MKKGQEGEFLTPYNPTSLVPSGCKRRSFPQWSLDDRWQFLIAESREWKMKMNKIEFFFCLNNLTEKWKVFERLDGGCWCVLKPSYSQTTKTKFFQSFSLNPLFSSPHNASRSSYFMSGTAFFSLTNFFLPSCF